MCRPDGCSSIDGCWPLRAALLFVIGALFTGMIVLEVVSRYLFDFSIFFINGAAQFLLVWFFLLGAGLALREGSHVGVEFLIKAVSTASRAHPA